MFNFDKAVEKALVTWYPKDHPLHMDPHHPLGKLLGEWGELLDDYMKSLYKPGYEFDPIDELGDIWYYIRILCYQKNYIPNGNVYNSEPDIDQLIAMTMQMICTVFRNRDNYHRTYLNFPYSALVLIARRYNITLDQLTKHNWNKLKPGSERGEQWMKARISTEYTGGKIAVK